MRSSRADVQAFMLGYRTLYECNRVSVVLTPALVATVLLTHVQRGITMEMLYGEVEWLRLQICRRGGQVVPISRESIELAVDTVLAGMAGRNVLVKRYKSRLMVSLYTPEERMELSIYRNQLLHHFVSEGLVACALYAVGKGRNETSLVVSRCTLLKLVAFLSQLLKIEVIFKPSPSINHNFDETIAAMCAIALCRAAVGGCSR